nr:immunoglobulin heavy chain junction region [Macaca mulatta]MOX00031.1 immunoglobulin heavy chain junction region [Macaca mulatta]MOX00791.1 immunoglobulin heavy chain junction region [Macaca mulatta]MOX01583.1 immunoglobulin heavy chain junction region [Macaca mulatta]MOX02080.1 immunoglobulin heavy chain junction region [Macaca mulatta]
CARITDNTAWSEPYYFDFW